LTKATIEIDYGYSFTNTIWIHGRPDLEGTIKGNRTYRSLPATLGPDSEDVLVLLDSFFTKSLHQSLKRSSTGSGSWRPRFIPAIRTAVRSMMVEQAWPPYAAVHVRTSDDTFHQNRNTTIQHVFNDITLMILEWLDDLTTKIRTMGESLSEKIVLYVATDAPSFHDDECFVVAISTLSEIVYQKHRVNVTIYSLVDAGDLTKTLGGGLLYSDLFVDTEIASSAPIAFKGTMEIPGVEFKSTLSMLISSIRRFHDWKSNNPKDRIRYYV